MRKKGRRTKEKNKMDEDMGGATERQRMRERSKGTERNKRQ